MVISSRAVATVALASMIACQPEPVDDLLFLPALVAETSAPLSHNNEIALTDDTTACVIESFELQVHCVDRNGRLVGRFGAEGEGPGEFRLLVDLRRAGEGRLAVFHGLNRVSVFEAVGNLLFESALADFFLPKAHFGSTIHGYSASYFPLSVSPPSGRGGLMPGFPGRVTVDLMEVDAKTGHVLWTRGVENLVAACPLLRPGPPRPQGGWVLMGLWECEGKLVFLDHRDSQDGAVFDSRTYVEELPNERDVAAELESNRRMTGWTGMAPPDAGSSESERTFRETPKSWFLRGSAMVFDDRDRLWVATNLDRDDFSYFDIWVDTDHAAKVRIRDRLMGYDLMGSTLVALVERKPGPNGIAERAIDWYDIGALEIGRPTG